MSSIAELLEKIKDVITGGVAMVILVVLELWVFEEEHGH
jgi:hypothetical protein